MIIHLLETNEIPVEGTMIKTGCGEIILFDPIEATYDDSRMCKDCLVAHRGESRMKRTYAIKDKRDEQYGGKKANVVMAEFKKQFFKRLGRKPNWTFKEIKEEYNEAERYIEHR